MEERRSNYPDEPESRWYGDDRDTEWEYRERGWAGQDRGDAPMTGTGPIVDADLAAAANRSRQSRYPEPQYADPAEGRFNGFTEPGLSRDPVLPRETALPREPVLPRDPAPYPPEPAAFAAQPAAVPPMASAPPVQSAPPMASAPLIQSAPPAASGPPSQGQPRPMDPPTSPLTTMPPAGDPRHLTEPIDRSALRRPVEDNVYRAKRPAVAVGLGVLGLVFALPALLLIVRAVSANPVSPGGVVSGTLLVAALPLFLAGLYGLMTGAGRLVDHLGGRAWLRPPLAYLVVAVGLLVAAGLAA